MIKYKKTGGLNGLRFTSLLVSVNVEGKRNFFRNRWRFSKKAKGLIVFAMIAVILISVFVFFPKQGVFNVDRPGIIESARTINSTVWMAVANNAWHYFQPGVGVDSNTGLPYSVGTDFTAFTDWDLGVYIQAVIDALKMNLTRSDGAWGSNARFEKVLTFLESRELNSYGYPYQFYQATNGKEYHSLSDSSTGGVDIVDIGRLFVALNNLRNFDSSLTDRINSIVLYGRSNYTALVLSVKNDASSNSIYSYYFDSGFASFWPQQLANVPGAILSNIVNSGNITTYGNVSLPKSALSGDPLLCSVFELNNYDDRLLALSKQVYLAHEAYYNATGQYVAFSEGNSPSRNFIWEWVILPNGDTWKIQDQNSLGTSSYLTMNPIIYSKVVFSFLALYNTTFSCNMTIYLERNLPDPAKGYSDGSDNSGHAVSSVGSNTNGLILDAAQYAMQNNP